MDKKEKEWYCRWSDRKNKIFYVNIKSRKSSWIKPEEFVATEHEIRKIADWKKKKRKLSSDKSTERSSAPLCKDKKSTENKNTESSYTKSEKSGRLSRDSEKHKERKRKQNSDSERDNALDVKHNKNTTGSKSNPKSEKSDRSSKDSKRKKVAPLQSRSSPVTDSKKKKKRKQKDTSSEKEELPKKKIKMTSDHVPISEQSNDFTEVFDEKRQNYYYVNKKNNTSQLRKPASLQVAETERAIENANLRKAKSLERKVSNSNLLDKDAESEDLDNSDDILMKSSLNVNAPCFEFPSSTLNVNAKPFVPRPVKPSITVSCTDLTVSMRSLEESSDKADSSPEKIKRSPHRKNGKRTVILRKSDPTPRRRQSNSPKNNHARVSAKDRLSLSDAKPARSVHARLGVRNRITAPPAYTLSDVKSNIKIQECDLIQVHVPPPHPETEIKRYAEVKTLRELFSNLCREKLGLEEPTEALNRWLLEQKLNCTDRIDPFFSFSDKKSVSMKREIMEDVPTKLRVPRHHKTCTKTLEKFVEIMQDLAKDWGEQSVKEVNEKCEAVLARNSSTSNTRNLMAELRESCKDVIAHHYKDKVDDVCRLMNEQCRDSARKVMEFCQDQGLDSTNTPTYSSPPSTRLVCCRPAAPLTRNGSNRDHHVTVESSDNLNDSSCRITYEGNCLTINNSHLSKLRKLYESSCLDGNNSDIFNSRVWCLLKRYKMLRSSIAGTGLCQENFGLHAALPHRAFELLNRKFHVTFECFASPFNCYFPQYCSAFPDIDCYFGSRGSFFDFKPKEGSFQANPPFSEEVMLSMAEHMINLLEDTQEPLMFVIFIPDWREPMTPAIPRLEDTIYRTHNILLDSRQHQYITGNQHLQSVTHYDAVHGTQVYVLQNDEAAHQWQITDKDMDDLRDAMSSNRGWH